jgi:hypothetical protein
MKDPKSERLEKVLYDLVSVAVFGFLVATVVTALSPDNLLRDVGRAAVSLTA